MISATIWMVKIRKPINITARNGHTTGFHPPEPVRSPVRMPSSQVNQQPPGNERHGGQDDQSHPDQVDIGQARPCPLVVEEIDAHMGVGRHRIGDGQHERAAHQERIQIVAPGRRCVEGIAQHDIVEHEHDQHDDQNGGQHAADVADPIGGTNQGAHALLIPQNWASTRPSGPTDDAPRVACPITQPGPSRWEEPMPSAVQAVI